MNNLKEKKDMYNAAIVGAGPAGIFTALELVKLKPDWKIILIEKGSKIEKRVCLLRNGYKSCPSCKTCGLLCGWGGAGAFSDGKLTLTPEVGGHLPEYMPYKDVEDLIKYCDDIYLEHGATDVVYGVNRHEFADIERAASLAELKLVHSPVRHLGTERSLDVLKHMQDYLADKIVRWLAQHLSQFFHKIFRIYRFAIFIYHWNSNLIEHGKILRAFRFQKPTFHTMLFQPFFNHINQLIFTVLSFQINTRSCIKHIYINRDFSAIFKQIVEVSLQL